MYYIDKNDKPSIIEKAFGIIKIKDNKLFLPLKEEIIKENNAKKLARKTDKILQKTMSRKLVLSKEIKKNEIYMNLLYSYGYDIVDGKWLFEILSCKILNYIVNKKNIKKEETSISLLVNYLTEYTLENIKILAQEYKTLNIVTNHLEKFKKIENDIYQKSGLMITVTNNKKKSLAKSKLILNIDFPKELINKYIIDDEAIIVNIHENILIEKKRYNGILINDYEISTKLYENNNRYFIKELYEAQIYKKISFREIQNKINNDKLEIANLYGINGKIL